MGGGEQVVERIGEVMLESVELLAEILSGEIIGDLGSM